MALQEQFITTPFLWDKQSTCTLMLQNADDVWLLLMQKHHTRGT